MTFACSGDGEPLHWKPLLLLPRRRSCRVRSPLAGRVIAVLIAIFLVSRFTQGAAASPMGPERSMVTGDNSNSNSNNNIHNKDIHNNNKHTTNNIHNYNHNTNSNSNTHLQQSQQHLQQQSHSTQQQQQSLQKKKPQESQRQNPSQPQEEQQPTRENKQLYTKAWRLHWMDLDQLPTCSSGTAAATSTATATAVTHDSPDSKCLDVDPDLGQMICEAQTNFRIRKMRSARLSFCDSYPVYNLVTNKCRKPGELSEKACKECFQDIEKLDAHVRTMFSDFEEILARYDCGTTFSSHWDCHHCKAAYRQWLCSMAIRYFHEGKEVPPCRVYCEQVENRCPYFLPELENQYAGEPSFLCRDSVMERQSASAPKPEGRCYKPCQDKVVCVHNDTSDADVTTDVSRTAHVTAAGHGNATSRGERSRSLGRRREVSPQTLWLSVLAQVGTVLWSSRTLSQHWVIGLT